MKANYFKSLPASILLATLALSFSALGDSSEDYTAHEWGTFTSLQDSDGNLIVWNPLETSKLPGFVYDWSKPGLNRSSFNFFGVKKNGMKTLQRMETPVVYFYTDKERTVDVRVKFPQGLITEWYPQAKQIGPSVAVTNGADPAIRHAYLSMNLALPGNVASNEFTTKNSLIHWPEIKLLPAKNHKELPLRTENAGSHYFAARETDSAIVRLNAAAVPEVEFQQEKFLFYRGTGNFKTPLHVTMSASGAVTLENRGKEKLAHLFLLSVQTGAGNFIYVSELKPNEQRTLASDSSRSALPLEKLQKQIAAKMESSLVKEGLFPREATAMVNTWKDSWFTENGSRVLYTLPRNWTDETLPMELNPKPSNLVRVMVGRAELITPQLQHQLNADISKALGGEAQDLQTSLKNLGRFADSIFYHVFNKTNPGAPEREKLSKVIQQNAGLN